MIINKDAPPVSQGTAAGRARVKAERLATMPAWTLAGQRGRPPFPASVSIIILDERSPHRTLGWWYLPNIVAMLQGAP